MRDRCNELNSKLTDKSEAYVVRSGRLMFKMQNGSFYNVNAQNTSNNIVNDASSAGTVPLQNKSSSADFQSQDKTQPKKVKHGSQVDP